jgi:hypothetical protein
MAASTTAMTLLRSAVGLVAYPPEPTAIAARITVIFQSSRSHLTVLYV